MLSYLYDWWYGQPTDGIVADNELPPAPEQPDSISSGVWDELMAELRRRNSKNSAS